MNAGLGGERAFADIGRVSVGRAVEHFIERARGVRQGLELGVRDADIETVRELALELQRRDDRDEVGVATALAEPIERALDLARAGAHRGERIGHRLLGIVMRVDADVTTRDDRDHVGDDLLDLVWQRAAIGVAEHHPTGAFVIRGLGTGECKAWIGLIAVEEMFAIEQYFAPVAHGGAHAVADRGEVFLRAGFERHTHVVIPGFRHKADGIGFGFEQRREPRIVRRRAAGTARHAERGEACFEPARLGEELRVGRICAGIAAFDVIDAELVQHAGYSEFIVERKIDAVRLRAVAQRGVEEIQAFPGHRSPQIIVQDQCDRDHDCDRGNDEVVALKGRQRHLRPLHCAVSLPARRFSIVVFASHSPPSSTVLRCVATNPRC